MLWQESTAEYLNLLSLLDSPRDSQNRESLPTSSSDSIGKLKEKFASYILYQSKSGSSRFKEYWVPVQMSNVQLEQYCSTLISNSTLLCSSSKHDIVGALRDVLMTCRKVGLVDFGINRMIRFSFRVVTFWILYIYVCICVCKLCDFVILVDNILY